MCVFWPHILSHYVLLHLHCRVEKYTTMPGGPEAVIAPVEVCPAVASTQSNCPMGTSAILNMDIDDMLAALEKLEESRLRGS